MPRLPAPEIARLKPLVLARVAEGEAVTGVMRALGLGATAAQSWAKRDAGFRAALTQAVATGRARWMRGPDPMRMAAFLARVKAGEKVADLWGKPGMPGRTTYFHWRATDAMFAHEMGLIRAGQRAALAAGGRAAYRPYDPELADAIYARLWIRGSMAKALAGDARMPCASIVARWRREQPEFDKGIREAMACWRRTHAQARPPWRETLYSKAMRDRVIEHVAWGGSLASAAREAEMPALSTLYRWMRQRPDFARAVWTAYDDRDLADGFELIGPETGGGPRGQSRRRKALRRIGGLKRRPGLPRRGAPEGPRFIIVSPPGET
ncbi:hypothetical protein [Phenylobacterium sp.]|uniref:terminase small subunit-like protein n=1 Tax=Phenylobacterium sp. TaxID=1871053 RepID=UPI003D268873